MHYSTQEMKEQLQKTVAAGQDTYQSIVDVIPQKPNGVFMLGSTATWAQLFPMQYVLDRRVADFASAVWTGGEVMARKPAYVNAETVIVASSASGAADRTVEVVEAARWAKGQGATVISIMDDPDSDLAQVSDAMAIYPDGVVLNEPKLIMSCFIAAAILEKTQPGFDAAEFLAATAALAEALPLVKQEAQAEADAFAEAAAEAPVVYSCACGPGFGAAYAFAYCKLMEMQWIHSSPINAGEFFHGPIEIADADVPWLLFKGEDGGRRWVERVEEFLGHYAKHIFVIDTKNFSLPGVPAELREYFAPLAFWPAFNTCAETLADVRSHPLSTRRYMDGASEWCTVIKAKP